MNQAFAKSGRRVLGLACLLIAPVCAAPIPYGGGLHFQDFDKLPATGSVTLSGTQSIGQKADLPGMPGWSAARTGGTASSQIVLQTVAETTGRFYSYGTPGDADRALGLLSSGTTVGSFGLTLRNTSRQTFQRVDLSYIREIWIAQGTTLAAEYENRFEFSYATSARGITENQFLTDSSMTRRPLLDAVSPASLTLQQVANATDPDRRRNGNSAAWRETVSGSIEGVDWKPGELLFLRWRGRDHPGFDAGMGIDDLTLNAHSRQEAAPITLLRQNQHIAPVQLRLETIPGRLYQIDESPDLLRWESGERIVAGGTRLETTRDPEHATRFFRAITWRQSPDWQEAFFTRPSTHGTTDDLSLENKILELLDLAPPDSEVLVCMYTWTRTHMAQAFVEAQLRGVRIRVILGSASDATEILTRLLPPGDAITCRLANGLIGGCHGGSINHNKFFLFSKLSDGTQHVVVQSSANFTNPQLRNQNNLVIIRNDTAIYDAYRRYWHDLERQVADPEYYRVALGETSTEARFSPRASGNGATGINDPVFEELSRIPAGSGTRIRVAMAYWTTARTAIANRLIALHGSGADVAIILYSTEVDPEILLLLRSAGVPVFLSPVIHSKYLLIDREGKTRVLTGSHNYTGNALRSNDEVLLSLDSPELHRQFMEDWEFMKQHPQTSW